LKAIDHIRSAIRSKKYRLSAHANEEMSDDDLESADVEEAILNGQISRKYTRDPRGIRYEVIGKISDGRWIAVICRFLPDGTLLIVTSYRIE
jgi:hypothetical protein